MALRRLPCVVLAIGMLASAGALFTGCGDGDESEGAVPAACKRAKAADGEYLTTLCEFHAAAAAGKIYDAYGYAEYFPKPQRAAIHAFCFVADRMLEEGEADRLADKAYLSARIGRKAEADLKSELGIVAPNPTGKAIGELESVLELDSLDRDLAERYVKACY